jgi:hypothetical protein
MQHISAVKMTGSGLISVVGSEFNVFLFARLGEDRNDTPLSVLSASARLNLDPWQEAAELAQLPRESAIQRLASSIAALAGGPPPDLEHGIIAARLISLLPHHDNSEAPARGTVGDASDARKLRAGMCMYAIFISFEEIFRTCLKCEREANVLSKELIKRNRTIMSDRKLSATKRPSLDLQTHLAELEAAGLLFRVDQPVNKDTELHPLVRCQFLGGFAEDERRAFLFTNVVDSRGRRYDTPVVVGALAATRKIYAMGMARQVEESAMHGLTPLPTLSPLSP